MTPVAVWARWRALVAEAQTRGWSRDCLSRIACADAQLRAAVGGPPWRIQATVGGLLGLEPEKDS